MNVRFFRSLLLLFLMHSLLACTEPPVSELQGSTMGTSYSVVIPNLPNDISEQVVQSGIESVLEQINQRMSTYIKESELSQLNQSDGNRWVSVSPELLNVIQKANSISKQTAGAFDVTIGPLVNLWGFGPDGSLHSVMPSDKDINKARQVVGYHKLQIKSENRLLRKQFKNLYIDLSAIAKGYGVDAVAAYLDTLGIENYLVEIGGELIAKGLSQRGDYWRVAVEKPLPGQRMLESVIEVADFAVATSGDYRNYFEKDSVRFSHTIDPRTGRPITHSLASVTVLSKEAMLADAWATALMVLGEKEGYKLAEKNQLAAYFLYRQDDGFMSKATSAFTRLTKNSE